MDCLDEVPLLLTNVFRYFVRNVQIQGIGYIVVIFLRAFITGYEPRMLFAISLTAEQISQSASFQVQQAQNEEWVQWPQIEIQPTTGALLSESVKTINMTMVLRKGRSQVKSSKSKMDLKPNCN